MQHRKLEFDAEFNPLFSVRGVQAAEMVLPPGERTGGPDNRHAGADQWLYVASGRGHAVVDGARQDPQEGSLLLIERGEAHEIRNTGDGPLRTLNFYSPPAYDAEGNPLPAGEG